jgi:hypothetical protein
MMATVSYLVFGDLHGRVLPAFRLALVWQREHQEPLTGLLQVGDLGFFPDPTRLDKATRRHAERDPMELGAVLVAAQSREADALFALEELPPALWFVPGNHEDYEALEMLQDAPGRTPQDFAVDYYSRVCCLRDGAVAELPGGLRLGGLWGIDDKAPNHRRNAARNGRIRRGSATRLAGASFDVLLTHDSPRNAMFLDSGSDAITTVIQLARPALHFFGHYHCPGRIGECDFGATQVFHLHGFELHGPGGSAEDNSVGLLRWDGGGGTFAYLDPEWLRTFTRHNWTCG